MYTTYHLQSAGDIDNNIIQSIKEAFKGKRIVITVEEEIDETEFLLSNPANKEMLLESLKQAKNGQTVKVTIPEK